MFVWAGGASMGHQYIPILVGCGQVTQREPDPAKALNALDLTAAAAREAAEDAQAARLSSRPSIRSSCCARSRIRAGASRVPLGVRGTLPSRSQTASATARQGGSFTPIQAGT